MNIYKVITDAHSGLKREFSNKKQAREYARIHRKDGWTATVVDMRTGEEVAPKKLKA